MFTISLVFSIVAIIATIVAIIKVAELIGRVTDAIAASNRLEEKCRRLELRTKDAFALNDRISRIEMNIRAAIAGVNHLSMEQKKAERAKQKPNDPTLFDSEVKVCKKCGQIKPLEDFTKDNRRKDGRGAICKSCDAARKRK